MIAKSFWCARERFNWIPSQSMQTADISFFSFSLLLSFQTCYLRALWSACHKKSYLMNLEVRNLKSEISCLCPVWLSQFCLFWKKMGKGFVNIPKFVNSTHNKYLFLWHADHIKLQIEYFSPNIACTFLIAAAQNAQKAKWSLKWWKIFLF